MALIPPHYIDCVVAIGTVTAEGKSKWIATGFLFGKLEEKTEDRKNTYKIYLVTNKHVLNGLNIILLRFNPKTDQSSKDYPIALKGSTGNLIWTGHPNPNIDVAVIPVNGNILEEEGMKFSFFQSDKNTSSTEEMIESGTTEGDFIYVLGFPMGIIENDRKHVFVRSGIISRIRDMFEKRAKDFVIDSPVFPGNSGGPVISKPEIMGITGTKSNERSNLIGIVKSYIPYVDVAVSEQTKRPRITFEENSGLSKVEPTDHILQTIEEIEKESKIAEK